jgi:hypothetical protein
LKLINKSSWCPHAIWAEEKEEGEGKNDENLNICSPHDGLMWKTNFQTIKLPLIRIIKVLIPTPSLFSFYLTLLTIIFPFQMYMEEK